ncbi:hypothetical protein NRF20_22270 [Streptomyces sp. R-74717]|uniref:hypothetical protein n=1 Tax=Streptomyces TaxID=1883 RepID=UPI00378E49A4
MRKLAFVLETHQDVFAEFAQRSGWVRTLEDSEDFPSFDERSVWSWQVPQGGGVRFVDDDALRLQYIEISGDHAVQLEEAVQEEFTCYDKSDCLDIVDLNQDEEIVTHALRLLTCTSVGEFDQEVFDRAIAALDDEREDVRIAALRIPRYTEWVEFLSEVNRVYLSDPSGRVRAQAGNVKLILELI